MGRGLLSRPLQNATFRELRRTGPEWRRQHLLFKTLRLPASGGRLGIPKLGLGFWNAWESTGLAFELRIRSLRREEDLETCASTLFLYSILGHLFSISAM